MFNRHLGTNPYLGLAVAVSLILVGKAIVVLVKLLMGV